MEIETQAAPSTAIAEYEVPSSNSPEYGEWRMTGKVAEPKSAETAAADASKETSTEPEKAKPAPGAEPGKSMQESRRKPGAEHRIGELTAEVKQLRRELEEARRPKDEKTESSPVKREQPQTYKEWREKFKPTEWANRYIEQHKDATMAEVSAELADYMAEVRDQYRVVEAEITTQRQSVGQKLAEARERYQDFDSVAAPVLTEMLKPDISREVFGVINDSPVLADLLYVIGGTEQSKKDFLDACRSNPSKALRMALLMEGEIIKEFGKSKETPRAEDGKFAKAEVETTPAKKSLESAPPPPVEINNRGAAASQVDRAFQNDDFSSYRRAKNAEELRHRRGV